MIQVSDFIAMFAPSSPKDIILIFKRRAFLCPIGSIVSKDIRLSIPIREYPFFIDCILVLWRDIGRRQPFLYLYISITFSFMPKNSVICNAVNNSTRTATSAHETCTSLTSFQTLETLIPQLHEARIRFRKNRVTGVFNITGRYTTMSAPTIEQLIDNVLEKQREYRDYISESRKRKATQAPCI